MRTPTNRHITFLVVLFFTFFLSAENLFVETFDSEIDLSIVDVSAKKVDVLNLSKTKEVAAKEKVIYQPVNLKEGLIGVSNENGFDDPFDNSFFIPLDRDFSKKSIVFLTYDLFGVLNHTGICRSINDQVFVGGKLVSLSKKWSAQKEQISIQWLRKGMNEIKFSLPQDLKYSYRIKNLKIEIHEESENLNQLVVNRVSGEGNSSISYIKGFVGSSDIGEIKVLIDGEMIYSFNNEFETLLNDNKTSVVVRAIFPNGEIVEEKVSLVSTDKVDLISNITSNEILSDRKMYAPNTSLELSIQGAKILLAKNSIQESQELSLFSLRSIDIPVIPPSMINVTGSNKAVRLTPGNLKIENGLELRLTYDKNKIPTGYGPEDVKSFVFEPFSKTWKEINGTTVDFTNSRIVSRPNKSGDYINGIIQVPESPETQMGAPTDMKNIKAGNPSANFNQVSIPTANIMGTANFSLPFDIPSGRQGMTPSLSLDYNSDVNETWCGYGWNVTIPSVSIETRWGVPRYDSEVESDQYTLNGEQLNFFTDDTPASDTYQPNRKQVIPRNSTGEKRFYRRTENRFDEIVRLGNTPKNYRWVVTDKMGTQYFYGCSSDGQLDTNAVLKDKKDNIGHWALKETRDLNGNFISYEHSLEIHNNDTDPRKTIKYGKQLYCKSISYTGHEDTPGKYKVEFKRNSNLPWRSKRKDFRINCRLGFERATVDLLDKVEISYAGQPVRSYELIYEEGPYFKTLLKEIRQFDASNNLFKRDTFSYFDNEVKIDGGILPLVDEIWEPQKDNLESTLKIKFPGFKGEPSLLNGNGSSGGRVGNVISFGISDKKLRSKSGTLGISYGGGLSSNEGFLTSIDINGDGLKDKVFKKGGNLYFRPNRSGPNGILIFGDKMKINGISEFNKGESFTGDLGFESHKNPDIFIGTQISLTESQTSVYFIDVNGDQLVDIVKNGVVYFNHIDSDGFPTFTKSSSDTPSPIIAMGRVNTDILQIDSSAIQERIEKNPLHDIVRVWIAPRGGLINIKGSLNLIDDTSPSGIAYTRDDGVMTSIQLNDSLIWKDNILAGDFLIRNLSGLDSIKVFEGDTLFFRIQSVFDGAYDRVSWSPEISYSFGQALTDANGLPRFAFKADDDFLITGDYPTQLPIDGRILFSGEFSKPITTDSLVVQVLRNRSGLIDTLFQRKYDWDEEVTNFSIEDSLDVQKSDALTFKVFSESNIAWKTINWKPNIIYTESYDTILTEVFLDGEPLLEFFPIVDLSIYPNMVNRIPTRDLPLTAMGSGLQIAVTPVIMLNASNRDNGHFIFTLKSRDQLLGKKRIEVVNGVVQPVTPIIFTDPDKAIFAEFFTESVDLAESVIATSIDAPLLRPRMNTPTVYSKIKQPALLGPMYRNWGQFAYNGNRDRADSLINGAELFLDDQILAKNAAIDFGSASDFDEMESSFNDQEGTSPQETKFVILFPDGENEAWIGYDDLTYVKEREISSSRLGRDDILPPNPFSNEPTISDGAFGVTKLSESTSLSANIAFNSGSIDWRDDRLDFMDFGGDGYPDIISGGKIQYTLPVGGLEDDFRNNSISPVRSSDAFSVGLSGGGTFLSAAFQSIAKKVGQGKISSKQEAIAKALSGVSANFQINADSTDTDWMDVNGDGLIDRINKNGKVRLNLGYSFSDEEIDWGYRSISKGSGTGYGGGLSANIENYSIGIGVGASKSNYSSRRTLKDVNGDGLIDVIYVNNGDINVHFNIGHKIETDSSGFSPWLADVSSFMENVNVGESVNGSYTQCVEIPTGPGTPPIKFCMNPQVNVSYGSSRKTIEFSDIDGDGIVDFLTSDKENELKVRRNKNLGKINKLKSISRALGSEITLDYKRVGNTYEMPNSVWTLSEVEVFDGFAGDGADNSLTKYTYENGYYDRHEREFYGFGKITTEQYETETSNDVYRKFVNTYINDNYYQKGLIVSETILDKDDNKFNETFYNYGLKNVRDGSDLVASFKSSDDGNAFSSLDGITKLFYEGQPTATKAAQSTFTYDRFGNVAGYRDLGDLNPGLVDLSPVDNYASIISYHNVIGKNLVGSPKEILVIDENGQTLRRRTTSIDSLNGNVTHIRKYLEGGAFAQVDMEYDDFGNISKMIRPENYKGERLDFIYEYDPEVSTYVTSVLDGYGYSSSSTYDFRFGQLLNSTDINGQETQREIDDVGRVTLIRGPYEVASGQQYTISFEYQPDAVVPFALTKHYDPQNPGNLMETVTFIDGLTRVLQVKKDAEIFQGRDLPDEEMRIVSGRVLFDEFGRTTESRYPVLEALNEPKGEFNPTFDGIAPSTTSYDILDRPIEIQLPDSSITRTEYGFGLDEKNNLTQFLTRVIDAEQNRKEQFTNVRGLVTATKDYISNAPNHGDIWTGFEFNAINELVKVRDDQENETTSIFDWFGRRVKREHPDHGACTFEFDLADNLIAKQTANLLAFHSDSVIRYEYEKERLKEIEYPIFKENNVTYEYGVAGDSLDMRFNRMGRVKFRNDGTGALLLFYDRLGEVNQEIRSIDVVAARPGRTFTTRYKYDTWNRLTRMVYPDGEILDYSYNRGGKLDTLSGKKLRVDYPYINKVGYDKFEQRVFCEYGNGNITSYDYDVRRRLGSLETILPFAGDRPIMDNVYKYDKVSNILGIKNNAHIARFTYGLNMGGPTEHEYHYDDLYRLVRAEGFWGNYTQVQKYELNLEYNSLHDITYKNQFHGEILGRIINGNESDVVDWQSIDAAVSGANAWRRSRQTTHRFEYEYNHATKPHAATAIGDFELEYDDNGNLSKRVDYVRFGQERTMVWDEEDRLAEIDDELRLHTYRYDANNERVLKERGTPFYIFVNGELVVDLENVDYTVYVGPHMVVNERGYTKHYFIGNERVTSKIGLGGNFGFGANWGDWDNWTNWASYDNWANTNNPDDPDEWIDWYQNSNWEPNDGIWNSVRNQDEFNRYYYHTDHLGNTGYITDRRGEIHQHIEYFPFGELFVYEHNNSDRTAYLFNGKELDEETGLNYYGARYYDSQFGRWLSVDPKAESYQGWSPYNYTLNNPVIFIDPNGESVESYTGGNITPKEIIEYRGVTAASEGRNLDAAGWATLSAVNKVFGAENVADVIAGKEDASKFKAALEVLAVIPVAKLAKFLKLKKAGEVAAKAATKSYSSFSALKHALGPAGKNRHWHHIVEQHADNIAKFGQSAIHNTKNVVNIPGGFKGALHGKITGHYNSLMPGTSMRVRDYVKTLPFEKQYEYGINVLKSFGWTQ